MPIVNIHEAKTQLSRLIERVVGGESLVIAKAGKPLVRNAVSRATSGRRARPSRIKLVSRRRPSRS